MLPMSDVENFNINKKCLKILKGQSEALHRRRTENAMLDPTQLESQI
jgi:hypothetical protein